MRKKKKLGKQAQITSLNKVIEDVCSSEKVMNSIRIEQYKLAVEMADRISVRRMRSNSFFVTINLSLLGLIPTFKDHFSKNLNTFEILIILFVLLFLCCIWRKKINSYKQLNVAKYNIIMAMEKKLPFPMFTEEWGLLGKGENKKEYNTLTGIEGWVPILFILIYLALLAPTVLGKVVISLLENDMNLHFSSRKNFS